MGFAANSSGVPWKRIFPSNNRYARSVIISPTDDFTTTRALLAVSALIDEKSEQRPKIGAIVSRTEYQFPPSIAAKHNVTTLPTNETLAKIIAHSCTQPGLSETFRELFGYYYPKVRCFLAGFIENEDDVKDLSQNIFVKIWLMRSVLCDIRSFGPYLYRMCRNAAIDYGRRHQVKIPLTDRYEEETAPLDEDYFAREMSWQYSRQVEKMPEKRRQVFLMSRVEGRSNAEIAQLLGITKKTVENHLNAALRELRKLTSCLSLFL